MFAPIIAIAGPSFALPFVVAAVSEVNPSFSLPTATLRVEPSAAILSVIEISTFSFSSFTATELFASALSSACFGIKLIRTPQSNYEIVFFFHL